MASSESQRGSTAIRVGGVVLIAGLLVAAFFVGAKYNADDKPGSSTATATKLLNQALRAQVAGDKASATKTFKLVLDIDPQNKLAHYNLGLIAQQRGDEAEADAAYRRAIAIDPNFAPALYNLGIVRAGVGDTPEAIILYTRATKADPKFAIAFLNLGLALFDSGRKAEADVALNQALALNPSLAGEIPKAAQPAPAS